MATNERDFPTIEELSEGFGEFRLPQRNDFVGRILILNFEDGHSEKLTFLDEEIIKIWCKNEGTEDIYSATYTAVSPRDNIFIIDFIKSYGDTESITVVMDFNKEIATKLVGTLPSKEEVAISQFERGDKGMPLTSVKAEFSHAAIDCAFNAETKKHEFTDELVGERIKFRYSSNDTYEHIYLNEKYYTWHCVSGIEKGLCDTDRCYYLKLDEKLYWFTWCEKVVPTVGTVVEDLQEGAMRSYGKLYGYADYMMGKVSNFPVGSYATVLNRTEI